MTSAPLTGIGVVVTRPEAQSQALVNGLAAQGAAVTGLALTRIVGRDDAWTSSERQTLASADLVAVTSVNGARELARQLPLNGCVFPAAAMVVAVGRQTAAALADAGIAADLVPREATSAAIIDALIPAHAVDGRRIVLARARAGRPELADGLIAAGADVHELPLYETVACRPTAQEVACALQCDIWTFLSPSSVDVALATVGIDRLRTRTIVSIGPTTTAHLTSCGVSVAAEASTRSAAGVVDAVISAARDMRATESRH